MAVQRKIAYNTRDFNSVRTEVQNLVKQYYPELVQDFGDASIASLMIDLVSAVGDMLSFHTDKKFNETQLEFAQERKSILALAKNMGLSIPGKRPSITIVDFKVTVPVRGDTFSKDYLPIIRPGSQAIGSGKVFETIEDIDFSDPFGRGGTPNRLIIPNIDANDKIQSYDIVKRELVTNGVSKTFKRVIASEDVKPFFELILPDKDVISIEQVIFLEGTNFTRQPIIDEFLDFDRQYQEVTHLAQGQVFMSDFTRISDRSGVVPGKWVDITKKFIKEYTDKGFCKLTFGSGIADDDIFSEVVKGTGFEVQIGDFLNNTALGEIPKAGTTLFVRYRVGGGSDSNLGRNVLTELGNVNMTIDGPRADLNRSVKTSLIVNNPIPCLGGMDDLSIEQIRKLISYNFSSQERCITIRDYMSRIMKMPGRFGSPFRANVYEEQNKIKIKILALDQDGKLDNTSTQTLKENISEYLTEFRMLNDYVEVSDGRVIHLKFEFDLFIDEKYNKSEIVAVVINVVQEELNIQNKTMNENIYIGALQEKINNVNGVINILGTRVFNKVGEGKYSLNEISQQLNNLNTREILLIDNTIFGEANGMFEIKRPEKDIIVRVKSGRINI